jgi:regulator of replication initiation timing
MSPEEIVTKFAEALEQFEAIVGQPTDSDLTRAREVLIQILIIIPFDEANAVHNLVGLIEDDANYKASYGASFVRPTKLPIYDKSIADDAKAVVRARMEAEHRAKRADYTTCETAEREAREFILNVVEDTWVRELKDETTFYAKVRPKTILDHLQSTCTGLHALDVLALQNDMQQYHVQAEGIPEYINMLEDAQKKARLAKITITDATLFIIATNAMLTSEQFPRANEDWEELDPADQTWKKWKELYKGADRKARTKKQAAGGPGKFGGANAATSGDGTKQGSGIGGGTAAPGLIDKPESGPTPNTQNGFGMEALDEYFDNLAAAATKEKSLLEELIRSNATLTQTNEELAGVIKKITAENRQLKQEMSGLRNKLSEATQQAGRSTGRGPGPQYCTNCKQKVYHKADDCFELAKNAAKRPAGWTSRL